MEKEIFEELLNKRVKLVLKNSSVYTGTLLTVEKDTIRLLDKFGLRVTIDPRIVTEIIDLSHKA